LQVAEEEQQRAKADCGKATSLTDCCWTLKKLYSGELCWSLRLCPYTPDAVRKMMTTSRAALEQLLNRMDAMAEEQDERN
jgi:hypothetical protein